MTDQQKTQIIDAFVYEPPTQQQYQYKIFINECNSYVGSQLVQQFRNDHLIEANPNIILGSLYQNKKLDSVQQSQSSYSSELPSGVNKIINVNNQRLYNSVLIQADIILFTLNENNIQELQYIIKLLKNSNLQKQKRLICITTLLSWGRKKNSTLPNKVTKDSLHLRNTLNYHIKTLQDSCLALSNQNQKVKGSVVFSGLIYGLGQDALFSYFKQALQQQKPLQIYGKGSNLIQTIHLKDLTQIVYNLAFKPYESRKNWHIACDSSRITQKQLICCIAQNLGNGSIVEKPIQQCFVSQNFDLLTMDLQINDFQNVSQWYSNEGIIKNIQSVVGEFNDYRGLKPNKILIIGPPIAGKSTISQILKKSYGLPVINIKNLIQNVQQDSSEFGKQIQKILEQIKIQKVQEERKAYEQLKKKKKGKGVEQFDPEKVIPRLPDQHLKRVIKWRLNFSDCLNKGYILDSVIKTYKVAEGVFFDQNGNVDGKTLPNSVFYIKATDDQVKERLKSIPPQKAENTHWNQQQTLRRLQTYSKENQEKSLRLFFDKKVDVKQIQINYQSSQIFTEFVQRNGPLGFKKQVDESKSLENKANQQAKKVDSEPKEQDQEDNEDQYGEQQGIEQQFNLQKLTAKEQKILNQKSRPIRQYLIDNVIPQITEGLLQICKQVPEDPINFLISFLEAKNNKNAKRKK